MALAEAQAKSSSFACRIYVGSLNFELTEQDVTNAFSAFGIVKSVELARVRVSQKLISSIRTLLRENPKVTAFLSIQHQKLRMLRLLV